MAEGPVKLLNQAVKAVKGENAGQLVEEFTAEMTLVAEGLVEDQARLRHAVEELQRSRDREDQAFSSALEAIENDLREQQKETDKKLNELSRRLDTIDKQRSKGRGKLPAGWMDKLLILAGIVCGSWVLVTVVNLFR